MYEMKKRKSNRVEVLCSQNVAQSLMMLKTPCCPSNIGINAAKVLDALFFQTDWSGPSVGMESRVRSLVPVLVPGMGSRVVGESTGP